MRGRKAVWWVFLWVLLGVAPAAAAFKYVEVGQKAPDFTLRTLDGREVSLRGELGAKALAVVFWATWSPRSRTMLGDLQELLDERGAQGFRVLAVNVDHEEIDPQTLGTIEQWAEAWSFPVLLDTGLATYYAYGVVATPSLALLDESGTVRFVRASYSSSAKLEIREAVDALLGITPAETGRVAVAKRSYVPPKKATLHYQKALVLVRRGMERKAVRDLEQAARLDPNWPEPRVLLARIYIHQARRRPSRLARAEKVLREAREIRPGHVQTLALLARVLDEQGKHDEALRVADEALGVDDAYTPALVVKARALRILGRSEDALRVIDRAMELDPRSPEVFAERGEVAAAQGRWQAAAEALRRAVELAWQARGGEG